MLWVVTDTGRPRKYATPDDLEQAIDAYFEKCESTCINVSDRGKPTQKRLPMTIRGLCAFLGISFETWSNYLSGDVGKHDGTHTEYREICTIARERIFADLINMGLMGEYVPTIVDRELAANCPGYQKNEPAVTNIKIDVSEKLDAECK